MIIDNVTQQFVPARTRARNGMHRAGGIHLHTIQRTQELRDLFEGRARWMDTRGARLREMGPTSSVGVATLPITHPDETGSGAQKSR